LTTAVQPDDAASSRPVHGFWPRLASSWLRDIRYGQLSIDFPNGDRYVASGSVAGPSAAIVVHRNRAVRRTLTRGDVGFAEAFMDGDWSTPDLQALLDFFYRNEEALAGPMKAFALFGRLLRLRHRLHANTRAGSRRNIAYHYDLGNQFYRLWLDPTMTYSSALFERSDATLEEAQTAKYRRIAETLQLKPGDHVLEIGCGWGGFAELAASGYGCRVTALTLSREQAEFARQRMRDKGLADLVEIRIQDYRDVTGEFDHIVSIEMFEAVGEEHWPTFFRTVHDRLKPGCRAALQIITVADDRFDTYRSNIDFIRRYIFPGGMLPTKSILARTVNAAGLAVTGTYSFASSYAETLKRWNEAFLSRWEEVSALGFDERFRRMWSYYLCGCAASFKANSTDVSQFLVAKG
jgi:cyclopropane-fatty-acyl-phospholipid synthase